MSMESDPTSVMGRRLGAVAIDGAIAFVPATAVFLGSITTRSLQERQDLDFRILDADEFCEEYIDQGEGFCFSDGDDVHYTDSGFVSAGLVLYGIAFALHVVIQTIAGGSLGKLATGIRVVDEQGAKAGFGRNLVRWLMWIVDSLPFFGLVALITSLTTTGHRRVGDMVAKTHVVRKEAVGRPLGVGHHSAGGPVTGAWSPTGAPAPVAKPGPQWDEARGTYIQWDPEAQKWMQWDEAAQRWDPIPPAAPAIPPPPPAAPPPPPPPSPPAPPPPPPSG